MPDWIHHYLLGVRWQDAFVPTVPLLDIVLRGSLIYLVLFALLRVTRRQAGHVGTSDVLVIVLIADAVQNAMASDYKSITEGMCLALTIFFWSWFLDWLAVHVPALRPLIEAPPRLLVADGRIDHRVLRRELMTVDDLEAQLRLQGIDDLREVRRARVESDGQLSVQRRR